MSYWILVELWCYPKTLSPHYFAACNLVRVIMTMPLVLAIVLQQMLLVMVATTTMTTTMRWLSSVGKWRLRFFRGTPPTRAALQIWLICFLLVFFFVSWGLELGWSRSIPFLFWAALDDDALFDRCSFDGRLSLCLSVSRGLGFVCFHLQSLKV